MGGNLDWAEADEAAAAMDLPMDVTRSNCCGEEMCARVNTECPMGYWIKMLSGPDTRHHCTLPRAHEARGRAETQVSFNKLDAEY
jgi:hypothetical protein